MNEGSGLTHAAGEFVDIDESSGNIKACTAGDNVYFGLALTTGKASSGQNEQADVVPCYPWVIFEGTVENTGTTASAIIKRNQMFASFALLRSSTNKVWYLDVGDATSGTARIVGFKDATGTRNGRVYFIIDVEGRAPELGLSTAA
jgi:hypothetical protein